MNAMKKMIVAAAVAVAGFAAVAAEEASSSETYSFTYQACLRDEHGEPIKKEDGQVQRNQKVTIRLWGDAASTEKPLWARKYAVYTDETGLFNLEVSDSTSDDKGEADGFGTPQYDSLAAALTSRPAGQVYIGLFVEGSAGEIVPRQRLFAVPFAAVANDVRAITKDIAVSGNLQFGTQSEGLVLSKAGIEQSGADSSSTFKTVQADVVRVNTIKPRLDGSTVTVGTGLDITGNATVEGNLKVNGTITDAKDSEVVPVPVGGIIMWTKSTSPEGGSWSNYKSEHWAICNGQNETPDLRGRFVVGANNGTTGKNNTFKTYDPLSSVTDEKTGGEETHSLSANEMPSHAHIYVQDGEVYYERGLIFDHNVSEKDNRFMGIYENRGGYKLKRNNGSIDWPVRIGGATIFLRARSGESVKYDDEDDYADYPWCNSNMHLFKTGTAGGGSTDQEAKSEGTVAAHENRPPYYALYYIMRIK